MKHIRADGTNEECDLRTDLTTLRKFVGGDVLIHYFGDGSSLLVNEKGNEEGNPLNLPVNKVATVIKQIKNQPEVVFGDCLFLTREETRLMGTAN